jgi:hypothetical protein
MSYAELFASIKRQGIVETHFHVGPEFVDRRYDIADLARDVAGLGALLVAKNHTYATAPLASFARNRLGADMAGGIVLNRFVGGVSPYAVLGAASGNHGRLSTGELPPVVVWMPTVHARAHVETLGHSFDKRWGSFDCCNTDVDEGLRPIDVFVRGEPTGELLATLDVVAAEKYVLATGHLSAADVRRLVPLALERGIETVIVTHPHYPSTELTDAELVALVAYPGVFVEHCLAIHTIEGVPLERIAAAIEATGPERVILSTDFGQKRSPPLERGIADHVDALAPLLLGALGERRFSRMFTANGRAALLGQRAADRAATA